TEMTVPQPADGGYSIVWLRRLVEWERGRTDRNASIPAIRSVALELFFCADADGSNCFPGSRHLAPHAGVKRQTAIDLRKRWRHHGWLTDTGQRTGRGGAVQYQLSFPPELVPDELPVSPSELVPQLVPSETPVNGTGTPT